MLHEWRCSTIISIPSLARYATESPGCYSVGDSVGVLVLDGDIRIFSVGEIYIDLVTTISSCEIPQAVIRMRLKVTQYNRSSFTVSLTTLHSLSSDYYHAT